VQGDLGRSFVTKQPVLDELWTPILNTLPMVFLAAIFAVTFGVLVGVLAAWRRGTPLEWVAITTGLTCYSLPVQWLGLLLIVAFAGVLPTSGIEDPYLQFSDPSFIEVALDRLNHMLLPALTLGIVAYGEYALITRSALLETLGDDYILTARAKGLSSWAILRRHALRNALLPVTTLVALSLGFFVGGEVLIETVFSYPGIGFEMYQAVFEKDYPLLQGAFLFLTLSVIAANLAADLLYAKLDPRVRA